MDSSSRRSREAELQSKDLPRDYSDLSPELIEFVRERLAHFKAPHGVTFVKELPKTATGKIQKYVLRGGKAAISAQ